MSQLIVRYGKAETLCARGRAGIEFSLALPLLAGAAESVFEWPDASLEEKGDFHFLRSESGLMGCHTVLGHDLETVTREGYERVFEELRGMKLLRIWHFLPRINEEQTGLERYRLFNRGRHGVFEKHFGESFSGQLPAASATGIDGDKFALFFLATHFPTTHHENPRQVNAWRYPPQFGPRAPSFARGVVASVGGGMRSGFLSGTASIIGSDTVEQGNLAEQIRVTWGNLGIMLGEMGFDQKATPLDLQVYLRRAEDEGEARAVLEEVTGGKWRSLRMVRSDICRRELDVEIEAVMRRSWPFQTL